MSEYLVQSMPKISFGHLLVTFCGGYQYNIVRLYCEKNHDINQLTPIPPKSNVSVKDTNLGTAGQTCSCLRPRIQSNS